MVEIERRSREDQKRVWSCGRGGTRNNRANHKRGASVRRGW